MPKVSVIIPAYNSDQFIRETIDSVCAQTMSDIELLVVDDGSTDDTGRVVESFGDERIKYFYKDNSGTPATRNYGLARAQGEYVAFLDHDDLWPDNFLEVMVGRLDQNPDFGLAYSSLTVRFSDGRVIKSYKASKGKSGWLMVDMFKRGMVWTSASLIRWSILEGFGYDEALRESYEDGDFFLRLSAKTQYLYVSEVEAIRREHSGNLSKQIGVQPTRIFVLERFYYELGGNKFVPFVTARKRLSHACRKVGLVNIQKGRRKAALRYLVKAFRYWPFDMRLYGALIRSFMLDKSCDSDPEWQMPDILAEPLYCTRN